MSKNSNFKKHLVVTTALAAAVFGYGRRSYAAVTCTPSPSPTYACSGAGAGGILLTTPDAYAYVNTSLLINEPTLWGFELDAAGKQSFVDHVGGVINAADIGLGVRSSGDNGGSAGSVWIDSYTNITSSSTSAVRAENNGTGSIHVTLTGQISGGPGSYSLVSVNTANGTSTNITLGATGQISGTSGISAKNQGSGALDIDVQGDINVTQNGILAIGYGSDLYFTLEDSGRVTTSTGQGVNLDNRGTGKTVVDVQGDIYAGTTALTVRNTNGSGVNVTTGTDSYIASTTYDGIWVQNKTSGAATLTLDGDVSAVTTAVYLTSNGAATATLGKYAVIKSSAGYGLDIETSSTSDIFVSGYVASDNNALFAVSGSGMTVHAYDGSVLKSNSSAGIFALNKYSGALSVTAAGSVIGKDIGIIAGNGGSSTTDLTVTVEETGSVTSYTASAIDARNHGTGDLQVTVDGDIFSNTSAVSLNVAAVYAYNQGDDLKVSVGLKGTINASGTGGYGIRAVNQGKGDLVITSDGIITSDGHAVSATSYGDSVSIDVGSSSYLHSLNDRAIDAQNHGTGSFSVTLAAGAKVQAYENAIDLKNYSNTTDLTVDIGKGASIVSDSQLGIGITHMGSGLLSITMDGSILSKSYGIGAANFNGSGLSLQTGKYSSISSTDAAGVGFLNYSGDLDVTIDGNVSGKTGGISTIGYAGSNDITILADVNADIRSSDGSGIMALHKGAGAASVSVKGNVYGYTDGIYLMSTGADATITTYSGSTVTGYTQTTTTPHDDGRGISLVNNGTGTAQIKVGGAVYGGNGGVYIYNAAIGGNVAIETYLGSYVQADNLGVRIESRSASLSTITVGGDVVSTLGAIATFSIGGGDVNISTSADSNLTATLHISYGVELGNGILSVVYGDTKISAAGKINAAWDGVNAVSYGGDIDITMEEGGVTYAGNAGVEAISKSTGATSVTVDGEINGKRGVNIENVATSGGITITTGANSKIEATGTKFLDIGIRAYNYGTGSVNATLAGYISSVGDDAVHIINHGDDVYLDVQSGSKTVSTDTAGIFVANYGTGTTTVNLDSVITGGGAGGFIGVSNAANKAGATVTVGKNADISSSSAGLAVLNAGAAAADVTIAKGASIAGDNWGLILSSPGTGGITVDTYGKISSASMAVQFGNTYFGGALASDVVFNIHGGQIIGDVVDYDVSTGHSIVNISGDFTSEGDFDVADFNVAKGAVFTLGKGFTVSAATDAIDIYGTFYIPEDPLITGDVDVHTGGLLDVHDITTITGFLKNDGTVSISHDGTVTADSMKTGTGTLYFGVDSASDHGLLTFSTGAADLTGQTIKINVGKSATFSNSDQIKIIDGAATLIGGPGSTAASVWDSSPAWNFQIVDGTGITDDSDLYLVLNASAPPPPIDGAIALATLTMADNAMDLTSDRLSSLRSGKTGVSAGGYYPDGSRRVWTQALGQLVHQGARDGVSGYSARLMGASIGADTDKYLGNGVLGLSFNYGNSHIDSHNQFKTDTDIDSYQLTFYGDYNWPAGWYASGMAGYAFNSNSTARHNADGAGSTAAADFNSQQVGMRGEMGRTYSAGRGYFVPFAVADWNYYTAQNYTETGAGSANLHVESKDLYQADLGIGGKLGMTAPTANGGVLEPELHAVYRRDLLGNNLTTSQAYVSGGAPSFTVESPDPARDKFTIGTQVRYFSPDNLELSASYDVELKEDYVSHTGLMRAGWRF